MNFDPFYLLFITETTKITTRFCYKKHVNFSDKLITKKITEILTLTLESISCFFVIVNSTDEKSC